jgi:hypothetical protein
VEQQRGGSNSGASHVRVLLWLVVIYWFHDDET